MAIYIPLHPVPLQFEDGNGNPLSGGTLEFYLSGTTTPANLYSNNSGTSVGTSVTLNSSGYPASGANVITLFRDTAVNYKIICKSAAGVTLWTADGITSVLAALASVATGYGAALVGVEDSAGNFAGDTVEEVLAELADDLESGLDDLTGSGSFAGALTGLDTSPTVTVTWKRSGSIVAISFGDQQGTSNSTALTVTGAPAEIFPAVLRQGIPVAVQENGTVQIGTVAVQTDGVLVFNVGLSSGVFTASGTKGVRRSTFSYPL